jgi:hypothetical protein
VKRVFPGFINPAETQTAFSDPPVGGLSYEGAEGAIVVFWREFYGE